MNFRTAFILVLLLSVSAAGALASVVPAFGGQAPAAIAKIIGPIKAINGIRSRWHLPLAQK